MPLIADAVMGALGAIIKPVTTIIDGWQQRKTAQVQGDIALKEAVTQAKIKKVQTSLEGDIAWENTALTTSGWKSGYMTIVLSIPMIGCFLGKTAVTYINAGFDALGHTPVWYQGAIGVMISATFGIKSFSEFMQLKKGA